VSLDFDLRGGLHWETKLLTLEEARDFLDSLPLAHADPSLRRRPLCLVVLAFFTMLPDQSCGLVITGPTCEQCHAARWIAAEKT
jgi:hypothetical protein